MSKKAVCLYLITFLIFIEFGVLHSAEEERPVLAVLTLQGLDISRNEAIQITQFFMQELFQTGAFELIERNQVDRVLEELNYQHSGVCDVACAVNIGHHLAAQKVVTGSVGRLENVYTLHVRMIDVETSKIENMSSLTKKCTLAELQYHMGELVEGLIGTPSPLPKTEQKKAKEPITRPVIRDKEAEKPPKKKSKTVTYLVVGGVVAVAGITALLLLSKTEDEVTTGSIQVTSSPTGAEIYLDGSNTGRTTNTTLTGISAGPHSIKLVKEGYEDFYQSVTVPSGGTATAGGALTAHNISVTSPSEGQVLEKDQNFTITWTSNTLSEAGRYFPEPDSLTFRVHKDDPISFTRKFIIRSPFFAHNRCRKLFFAPQKNSADVFSKTTPSASSESTAIPPRKIVITSLKTAPGMPHSKSNKSTAKYGKILLDETRFSASSKRKPAPFLSNGLPGGEDEDKPLAMPYVSIELYKGGNLAETIASGTENDGSYDWKVPQSLAEGGDYRIRISCSSDPGVYSESGEFSVSAGLRFIKKWGNFGSNPGQFKYPTGIVCADGVLHVTDTNNHRIQKYNTAGGYLGFWGSEGEDDGEFGWPSGIAVDRSGYIYIVDYGNHNVQKFTSGGAHYVTWGEYGSGNEEFDTPWGIAVDNSDYVYVADSKNHCIKKFSSNGHFVKKWGSKGSGNNQFNEPVGIAVSSTGSLYVTDSKNCRVMQFSSDGQFVRSWGSPGTGEGQFQSPRLITVDSSGNVYVADTENSRIQKFTATGDFITTWGEQGQGNGQFFGPRGLAVRDNGEVFVVDSGNHRIQKFGY